MKEDVFWMEDNKEEYSLPTKRRRRNKTDKLEFIGWGSRPLIEFLDSIGEGGKKLTQHEVASIINHYVSANNLLNPQKKRKVLCDGKLHELFGKKTVPRIKIYDLLEVHFAENHDESEESCNSEEEDEVKGSYKDKKAKNSAKKQCHGKRIRDEAPKSCFAAIIPHNIKLVYLKRSLVQELLKLPESFEEKTKGSFVRVKSDPNDYLQKYPHHIEKVTGVSKISEAGTEICLLVTNSTADIPLNMLSDDNFSEEECEDLRERVKAGLIQRPTIVELEAKAKMLHEDITKHWIAREIASLKRLIDRANEKGWRRELHESLDRRQLLQSDSEQKRLLLEIPAVIADELEPQPITLEVSIRLEENGGSPKLNGLSDTCQIPAVIADELEPQPMQLEVSIRLEENVGSPKLNGLPDTCHPTSSESSDACNVDAADTPDVNGIHGQVEGIENPPVQLDEELPHASFRDNIKEERQDEESEQRDNCENPPVQLDEVLPHASFREPVIPSEVIELSDDEDEPEKPETRTQNADGDLQLPQWYYVDPQEQIQGPFTILTLKRWSDSNYFTPDFKVWKADQSREQAVFLVDVLHRTFHAE